MRLPCAPSRVLKAARSPPWAFTRNGPRRWQHTTRPFDAAVVGGGITGLTAAYRLSQDPKCAKVTLYEKSSRLGGWLQSETIPVENGDVVFEYGPRTLRTAIPACLPLLDLIVELGLHDDVLLTSKTSPAALNRYVYYPDHLVRMPAPDPGLSSVQNFFSMAGTVLREPVFEKFLSSVLLEPIRAAPDLRTAHHDESIADFVSRRFSPAVADNIVSALYHGIYAGDISRLSAQMMLGHLRNLEHDERRVIGGFLNNATSGIKHMLMDDLLVLETLGDNSGSYLKSLSTLINKSSVMTFKKGVGQLSDALAAALSKSEKVDVVLNTDIESINKDEWSSDIKITHNKDTEPRKHNRVISTIPAPALADKLDKRVRSNEDLPRASIDGLRDHNYAVTVMVVNLYYPNPDLLPVTGFGYLIPRSIPYEQNPEMGLGVIFGSDSSVGQDTAPGTKLTVMMGGHYWDGWKESDYPDGESAVDLARSMLERHLGITDRPTVVRTRLQRNAIPQYTVGHLHRMQELSNSVRDDFDHRLGLAGCWYNGVGVVDCIRQAYMATSYGVGGLRVGPGAGDRPWRKYNYQNWDLEGGISTAPIRNVEVYRSERKHY